MAFPNLHTKRDIANREVVWRTLSCGDIHVSLRWTVLTKLAGGGKTSGGQQ